MRCRPLLTDPSRLVADSTHISSIIERNLEDRTPLLNWHLKHHSPAGAPPPLHAPPASLARPLPAPFHTSYAHSPHVLTRRTHRTRWAPLAGAFSDGLTSSGSMLEALVGALQMPSPEQMPAHIAEKRRQLTAKKRQLAMGTRNGFSMGTENVGAKAKQAANKQAGGKIALSGAPPRKVTSLHMRTHTHEALATPEPSKSLQ